MNKKTPYEQGRADTWAKRFDRDISNYTLNEQLEYAAGRKKGVVDGYYREDDDIRDYNFDEYYEYNYEEDDK